MITPVSLTKIRWARSEVVITPPCHGGDRRFKSGRARQVKRLSAAGSFYLVEHAQGWNRR